MYLSFVLAAILALSALVSPGPKAPDSSGSQDRAVEQTVAGAGKVITEPPVAPSYGVSLKKLDIVVPPVKPSDMVAAPEAPLEAQAAPGLVVADQLVAPKRVESEVVKTAGYQTLGVTWPESAKTSDLGAQVRTRSKGKWSGWIALGQSDAAPDAGTPDAVHAVRGGTDPLSIGNADAVQLAFSATAKGGPQGLSLALIGSAERPASATVVGSSAVDSNLAGQATIQKVAYSTAVVPVAATSPRVISRAQWGAPAQQCAPSVVSTLVGATLHHTAGSNSYSTLAAAEAQIRGDAAYHINALGWCDIGYNFVVDKWGNIYEGRAGSLTQAVVGAHAGGFNSGTVGVAMLGTYDAAPPAATQLSVAQIIGWRLGAYGVDPKGSMTYSTGDGGVGVRYKNQTVSLPRVFGHRDVWFTACPGNGGESALPYIRAQASSFGYAQRFTQAKSVVKALYQDLLLRPVDPGGLQTWSAMLAGGASQSALVASLTKSREYVELRLGKPIRTPQAAYWDVLGRASDAGGMAAWSREILAGRIPVDDVQRRFYASQEFLRLSGGTNAGFVAGLYQSILGRQASPAEVVPWVGMASRYGRGTVADSIWFSNEAAMRRAGYYYQLFLKRAPDPAGQRVWANVLLKQGESAVRVGMAGSGEYRVMALNRFP